MIVLTLSGCLFAGDTYDEQARSLCHPAWGCVEAPWWPDRDADGWGDPDAEPTLATERPEGHVNNALDCDDALTVITGRVQVLCPADFLSVRPADHRSEEGRESLVGPAVRALDAHGVCAVGWGGRLGADAITGVWSPDPAWVALDPADLAGWEDAIGFGVLVPGQPVYLDAGILRSGAHSDVRPFFCSRPTPDPADWYTRTAP